MKYYCTNCKSYYEPGFEPITSHLVCPLCWGTPGVKPVVVPDYETPSEYKARTGKELSDGAQVWWRFKSRPEEGWFMNKWKHTEYGNKKVFDMLVGGPEPPPDGWKGE
jgi:hypothetical protein